MLIMYPIGMKNLTFIIKYVFITPWCPVNGLEWYKVIILSAHTSSMANTVASLSGFDTILNNNESSNIYIFLLVLQSFWLPFYYWAIYSGLDTNIYLWSKDWLDILPVFPLLSQVNVHL